MQFYDDLDSILEAALACSVQKKITPVTAIMNNLAISIVDWAKPWNVEWSSLTTITSKEERTRDLILRGEMMLKFRISQ